MAVSDIPLLNDYKKKFVLRRIPQTLFGGLNTGLGVSAPWYAYGYRIILWFLPWLVGSMFVIAAEVAQLHPLYASIGYGLLMGLSVLLLQILSKLTAQRRNKERRNLSNGANDPTHTSETGSINARMLLSEDDEVDFDSCCSVSTFLYLIPPKRYYINVVLHASLSSLLCGLGLWYSLPSVISSYYGTNTAAGWIIFIFSWITICISHFPLLIGIPIPEVASYRLVSIYETQNAWRAVHALLFLSVFLLNLIITSSTLSTVSSILQIIFCTLPILWLIGIVPPVDALLLWSMEQFLIFGLGGSCMATDMRIILMFLMTSSILVWTSFLSSPIALVGCCAALGYILSTDVTSIVVLVFSKLYHAISRCVFKNTPLKEYNDGESLDNNDESLWRKFTWKICLLHAVMLIICLAGSVLCRNYIASIDVGSFRSAFNYVFIALFTLVLLTKHIQRVYVFFRIFRNCLYPFVTLPKASFKKKMMRLRILGYLHIGLIHVLFPLLATVYLGFFVFPLNTQLPSFLVAFGTIHAARFIWQRPGNAIFTFLIASVLDLVPAVKSSPWGDLTVGTQLLILDLCRDRFFQFIDNFWFAVTLIVTSWSEKKQRRSRTVLLICLNVIFFPIPLLVIAIASILSAPILPLFTLPIFFVGFPRPVRFWSAQPGSVQANICADSIYYKQLLSPVSESFSSLIKFGAVNVNSTFANVSSFYLARSQDKTLWIQVLESGFGYTSIAIKGLELQETSCHALETTRLDDAFDIAFENGDADLKTNPYIFASSATPLSTGFIESYSDAKNSLAGIVDQPDFMKDLRKDFLKSLTWLLVHHLFSLTTNKKFTKPASSYDRVESDDTVVPRLHTPGVLAGNGTVNQISEVTIPDFKETQLDLNQGSKISLHSDSIISFSSLLSSDDEGITNTDSMKPKSKKSNAFKMGKQESTHQQWSSQLSYKDDSGIIDNILSDLYDPMIDQGKKRSDIEDAANKSTKQMLNFGIQKSSIVLYDKNLHNDDLFLQLIPQKWNDIPLFPDDLDDAVAMFDNKWLQHCVASASSKYNVELELSQHALASLMKLVLACDAFVNVTGVPGKDFSLLTRHHMHQVYSNQIPWSPMLDWLNERKDLHSILIKSYRYAVKLIIDEVSLGPVEDWSELSEYFSDYDKDWFIGLDMEPNWKECINQGKPFLFGLSYNETMKDSRTRVLSKRKIPIHTAEIDAAAVRGLWANLTFELIYATNDDEERYSAQAHLPFLRNLVIQTADPPLGYPILSSSPITISTPPFVL